MRQPLIAGNWKMNLVRDEVVSLLDALVPAVDGVEDRDVLVCPAFPYLALAAERLSGTRVRLGAQDMGWEAKGAFTGAVSPAMLADCGATDVILGHSERRHVFGEDDAMIRRKVGCAIDAGIRPILCVGETLDEREAGETWAVIERQLTGGLDGLDAAACDTLTIAYEPVWAIGTGHTATPAQAQEVHRQIRGWLAERFGDAVAARTRILYGGSVNPKTIDGLMAESDVDGGLVGGASLKAADFAQLVNYGRNG